MPSYSKLESTELPHERSDLLRRCFTESSDHPELRLHNKTPDPSDLHNRVIALTIGHPPQVMEAVLHSVHHTWDSFHEGPAEPREFLRAPFGAAYEFVSIPDKGLGIVASRDNKAGEVVMQETPVLVLSHDTTSFLLFITLPPKALEAILLLHNQVPGLKEFSEDGGIPINRLLNILSGVLATNAFGIRSSAGDVAVLLLAGSLFNHSDTPNITESWENTTEKMLFTSLRDIKEGEELELDYAPGTVGQARADRLKFYGIS